LDNLALFILLALIAEILGTIGGFGSSLFFIPIASYFLDFHSVLGITALFHVTSNISKIAFFRKGVDKKIIIHLGIPAVIMVVLGAYLSKFIETKVLEISLGIFLIITSLIFLIHKNFVLAPTKTNAITGGALSGFIAGVLGTGGAIRGITLTAFNLKTDVFIATSAVIDLTIDASRSVVYGLNGYVHRHDLYLIPILFVVSIAGTYIGKLILNKVSQAQFKGIVLFFILGVGIFTIVKLWFPNSITN
jgi:uncharacterized protein